MAILKSRIFAKSKKTSNFFIVLLFFISFFLVFINKTDLIIASKIKNISVEIFSPISYVFSYPVKKTTEIVYITNNLKNLYKENQILEEEIRRLKQWQTLSLRLINENKAYKKLLDVNDESLELHITVKVLTKNPGLFTNMIQINGGKNKNIKNNSTVINERGLVGRIINVGSFSSRTLLINDINSSIPITNLNQDIDAIIKGQSDSNLLKLKFIRENLKPKVGQILITSGNAGIFPKNIAVGKVYKIEKGEVFVKPFVNFDKLDFVSVVTEKKR
tara:strand:+ start:2374 stop:3198 length:825 start_codon:yes stop_codon:yes gene_type:complete